MQTAYQVGKGYLTEMLENKDDETLAETRNIEKVSSNPYTKKKTKLTSAKNQKKKKIKKLEQDSIKNTENKFDESNNKNDISKKKLLAIFITIKEIEKSFKYKKTLTRKSDLQIRLITKVQD